MIEVDHYHAVEVLKACGAVLILHVSREVSRLVGHPVFHEDGSISQIGITHTSTPAAHQPTPEPVVVSAAAAAKHVPVPLQIAPNTQTTPTNSTSLSSGALLTPHGPNGGGMFYENGGGREHKVTLHTTLIRDQIGQGLGFSIAGGKSSPPFKDGSDGIYISRLSEGGLAQRDGKIMVGDKVLVVSFFILKV